MSLPSSNASYTIAGLVRGFERLSGRSSEGSSRRSQFPCTFRSHIRKLAGIYWTWSPGWLACVMTTEAPMKIAELLARDKNSSTSVHEAIARAQAAGTEARGRMAELDRKRR